jgi:hypothetical protein
MNLKSNLVLLALQKKLREDLSKLLSYVPQLPDKLSSQTSAILQLSSIDSKNLEPLIEEMRIIYQLIQTQWISIYEQTSDPQAFSQALKVMEYIAEVVTAPISKTNSMVVQDDHLITQYEELKEICFYLSLDIQTALYPLQQQPFICFVYGYYRAFLSKLFQRGFKGSGAEAGQKFRIVFSSIIEQLPYSTVKALYYQIRSPAMTRLTVACDFASIAEEIKFGFNQSISGDEALGHANITQTICDAIEQMQQAITGVYENRYCEIPTDINQRFTTASIYQDCIIQHVSIWQTLLRSKPNQEIDSKNITLNLLQFEQNKLINTLLIYYLTLLPFITREAIRQSRNNTLTVQENIRSAFQKNFEKAIQNHISRNFSSSPDTIRITFYEHMLQLDELIDAIGLAEYDSTQNKDNLPLYKTLRSAFLPLQAAIIAVNTKAIWVAKSCPLRDRSSGNLKDISQLFRERSNTTETLPVDTVSGCQLRAQKPNKDRRRLLPLSFFQSAATESKPSDPKPSHTMPMAAPSKIKQKFFPK